MHSCKWLANVKSILDNCGHSYIWSNQSVLKLNKLKCSITQVYKDQYIQEWNSKVDESGKCINYKIFKTNIKLEKYLLTLPKTYRILFTRFRLRNHKLPIEIGAHRNIPRNLRKCKTCNVLGDEFHYLFVCTKFSPVRSTYIKRFYLKNPSTLKMHKLLNSKGTSLLNLCKFIKIILNSDVVTE